MNYKTGIEIFRIRLNDYLAQYPPRRVMPEFTDMEILLRLSETQAFICNKFKLVKRNHYLKLVSGQYRYAVDPSAPYSGYNTIPNDILVMDNVWLGTEAETPVLPTSMATITGGTARGSGLPDRYAIDGADNGTVLEINTKPDKSYSDDSTYKLVFNYSRKIRLFDPSNYSLNSTWDDFDPTKTDYDGNFKIPEDYFSIMVMGAISKIVPQITGMYENELIALASNKSTSFPITTQYWFGVENAD